VLVAHVRQDRAQAASGTGRIFPASAIELSAVDPGDIRPGAANCCGAEEDLWREGNVAALRPHVHGTDA
jgi:hypothetical protein